MKKRIYLSLGSNLGNRSANLLQAIERLRELGTVSAISGFYETEPIEVAGPQPWYLNCVIAMETELMPRQFLKRSLALERELGRRRTGEKSPRTLDIDILLFGEAVVETADLTIPHPGLPHRRFVLAPLAEIAPDLRLPASDLTVTEMLRALPASAGIVRKAGKNEA